MVVSTGTATGIAESFAIDTVRAEFPYLAQCTYLNTASAGLAWPGQGVAAAEFYEADLARGIAGQDRWRAQADAARDDLARLLSVLPSSIEFVRNTTEAMNLIALSLPLGHGDRVAFAEDEFPSVALPWRALEARGVEVIPVPIAHESERTDALVAAVGPGTRVLAVSHVHWRTGTRLDLVRLAAACRTTDCRLIVDGAHGIGAVSVDASAVDAYCAPTFKWLLSGFGLGILALSDRLASELVPALRGYGNTPPSRSLEYGHVNYPGVYALRATLGYLRALGWSGIHWRVDALASMLAANIRARGFEVLTPDSAHAGIVAIRHDDAPALVRALAERSIHVEARDGVVRVAAHFYNTSAEIHAFADTLDALCGDRRRTP